MTKITTLVQSLVRQPALWTSLIIGLSTIGILFNHTSFDIGRYAPENEQQAMSIERGRLVVLGPYAVGANMDGSLVPPLGVANDLRTAAIDVILAGQAISLLVLGSILRKNIK